MASLTQRVEALEQISHSGVIERVGRIEQRVSRIESAREAEDPHLATKSDIARLETRVSEAQRSLEAQNAETREMLLAENAETREMSRAENAETREMSRAENAETREMSRAENAETRETLLAANAETREMSRAENAETRETLRAEIAETRETLLAEIARNRAHADAIKTDLDAKINAISVAHEQQLRRIIMWLVGVGIAVAAVVIAAVSFILSQMQ